MSKNPTVTVELTEKELSYLQSLAGFPRGRFPHLQAKLYAASKDMRSEKRIKNREHKQSRADKKRTAQHPTSGSYVMPLVQLPEGWQPPS